MLDENEVRAAAAAAAAAERLRRVRAGEPVAVVYPDQGAPGPDPVLRYGGDVETLADAYLAIFPADDGEAVTEELLRARGMSGDPWRLSLRPSGEDGTHLCFAFAPVADGDECPRCWVQHVWRAWNRRCVHNVPVPWPGTAGGLRRLCAALGVALTGEPGC